eukprot:TRINITY_DN39425_c0_g1_i1.p1 TRINITY_DN39425_c0_g1~~TRINITY_DN39425_c0_g1_i1.p1  ORF type:complete len:317 (+),score=81.90 TRINITY_DN39425_c0_g1_i1:61-1011(+)
MALQFEGKVAIVTGAGNGLGKEYARLLASRGAKVVVNDLGGSTQGSGSSTAAADTVVAEITQAGGEAVASYDSVVDGEKIVQLAIDKYGRVDILINNAGILRDASFRKMSDKDWDLVYQVHLKGMYKVTRAAWPYMEKSSYGRIVNVSSPAGLYGNFGQANYSAMKRAAIGFSLVLAAEGEKKHIKVNVIAPLAASRIMQTVMSPEMMKALPASSVATFVAFLCHESCEESGSVFELGGNWISKVRWQRSRGVRFPENFTVEDVAAKFSEICDFEEGSEFPRNAVSGMKHATAKDSDEDSKGSKPAKEGKPSSSKL